MARYVVLSTGEARGIVATFGLSLRSAALLPGGRSNSSYLADCDEGRFLLTAYTSHGGADVGHVNGVMRRLAASGSPVPAPLVTKDGAEAVQWGGHVVTVRPYVEGSCTAELPDRLLPVAGAALARIHLAPPPADLPSASRRITPEGLQAVARDAPPYLLRWLDERRRDLAAAVEGLHLPEGLAHGDYWPDNVIVTATEAVVPIDFAEAHRGNLVDDLGCALVSFPVRRGRYCRQRARLFLAGYEAVRPLTAEERLALHPATVHAGAAMALRRYWRYHVAFPEAAQQRSHLELVAVVRQCMNAGMSPGSRGQYAPRRPRTATTVFAMMDRSSSGDQFST